MNPAQAVSPTGNYATSMGSPEFQAWLRQQLLEQSISAQSRQAISRQPPYSGVPGGEAIAPPPILGNPPVAPPPLVAPPQAAAPQAVAPQPQPLAPPQAAPAAMPPTGMPPPTDSAAGPMPADQSFDTLNAPDNVKQMFVGPAKTPEEIAQRKSVWTEFVDKLKNDPELPAFLTKFGTSMLQPVGPGQTPAGHFGSAVQGSLDYLQTRKLQAAELAKTQAETGRTGAQMGLLGAQTVTEGGMPAKIGAEVGALQAGTKKTQEEAATISAEREGLVKKLGAEVDKLKAGGQLEEAQAQELWQKIKDNPGLVASTIALQKAHAYYFTHPEMHARALESARLQSVNALADAFVHGGDDELTKLYKTDPTSALNKARVQAQAGQVGQFWQNSANDREAEQIFRGLTTEYDQRARTGDLPKKMTKEAWITQQLILRDMPADVKAKIWSKVGRAGAEPTPGSYTNPKDAPGAWSIEPAK